MVCVHIYINIYVLLATVLPITVALISGHVWRDRTHMRRDGFLGVMRNKIGLLLSSLVMTSRIMTVLVLSF